MDIEPAKLAVCLPKYVDDYSLQTKSRAEGAFAFISTENLNLEERAVTIRIPTIILNTDSYAKH